jgi:hypothetical protein
MIDTRIDGMNKRFHSTVWTASRKEKDLLLVNEE